MTWRLETDISGFKVRRSAAVTAQYRAAGYWREETLADIAGRRAQEDPTRLLIIEGERRITRGEAWEQALRLCGFFQSRGLQPGDVVSFQLPNWIEASIVSLAVRMSGLVVNPVPPIYRESEVSYILGHCGSKLIFVPESFRGFDYAALYERMKPQLPNLRDVVTVRGTSQKGLTWQAALDTPPPATLPTVDPAAVMMAMYTSGTTARPKGVLHSHQTYGFKVQHMAQMWGITDRDIFFMPSPLTHITGAFWSVDMPWAHGASSVLMDVWSAEEGIRAIQAYRCTLSGGATPFLQQLLDVGARQQESIASLRIFFCGGTTVSADLIKRATTAFPSCMFFRSYGCTEMPTTSMGIKDRSQAELGAQTDGEIVSPTEVKIVSPETHQVVADGEEGEILARGPEQFLGYLHVDDESDFDTDGYFHTGDLGRRVQGNYLVITGRKKDIIIRSGENISPKEVEDVLYGHPDIADIAIVAMPSPTTGEKGCAFIVPRAGAHVDLASIRQFLEGVGLARQKFPEHVVLVNDLPRVPSGKVRKDVLRTEAKKIAAELAGARAGLSDS